MPALIDEPRHVVTDALKQLETAQDACLDALEALSECRRALAATNAQQHPTNHGQEA